jgi:CP family cyanate transporter-like MFS transporter
MIARLSCLFAAITGFIAIAGLIVNPGAAPILWVCLLALTGLLCPLSLTLLALSARTHLGAAALSAFVQGLGYTTAAVLIVVFGVLHELFDGWVVALILLIFVVAAAVPASLVVTRSTTVEEEWERHHGPW